MPIEDLVPTPNMSNFTEGEKEQGLHMVALCSGNTRRASRELASAGFKVNHKTLWNWKNEQPDRYQRIEDEVIPQVYAELARRNEELGLNAVELEQRLIGEIADDLSAGRLESKDKPTVLRNVAVAGGIAQEKGALARGRPTSISNTIDPVQMLRSIATKYPGILQVDAEVEVIEPTKDHPSDPAESS